MAPSQRTHLLALLGAAALLRLAVFVEYVLALPFVDAPLYDSEIYLAQARAVAELRFGDATLLAFSPLYGYFLALTGGTLSLVSPLAVQLVLGCACALVLYRTASRMGGHSAGLVAGGLFIGYGLPLHYEMKLLSESLSLFLVLVAFDLYLSEPFARGHWRTALAAGVVFGFAVLARASLVFTPFFLVAATLLPWVGRADPAYLALRARTLRALIFAAGLGGLLVANGVWSYAHSGLFVPVILVSRTAEVSVGADVRGDLSAFDRDGSGGVSPWDVVHQAEEALRDVARPARGSPGAIVEEPRRVPTFAERAKAWLERAPDKAWRTFSDYELTFYQYGYYGERSELGALGATPVSFGMLASFALLGAVLLARRSSWRALLPFLPLVLGPLVTTTIFHPDSRYRLAMIAPFFVLAGAGIAAVFALEARRARLVAGAACGIVFAFFALRTWSYELRQPAIWELQVAEGAAGVPDPRETVARIERARALAPGDPAIEARIHYVLARLSRAQARAH